MDGESGSNTLMLGNGFTRTVYRDVPEWRKLYCEDDVSNININNYALLYEVTLLQNSGVDNQHKREIVDRLRRCTKIDRIKHSINDLTLFGKRMEENYINNIITTNFDKGIENILCRVNGYSELQPRNVCNDFGEKIYSIRRRTVLQKNDHKISVWKIHGDIDNLTTVLLGFDHYCGALSKIGNYIKGRYVSSSSEQECNVSMVEKCRNNAFDDISWIELFFKTNVYIAGFGMDFSEIDIWWLLNKRFRMIKQGIPINNRISFLYSTYDKGNGHSSDSEETRRKREEFEAKTTVLDAFSVNKAEIQSDENFIRSVFENIAKLEQLS